MDDLLDYDNAFTIEDKNDISANEWEES